MAKRYELDIEVKVDDSLDQGVAKLEKLISLKKEVKGDLDLVSDTNIKEINEVVKAQSKLITQTEKAERAVKQKIRADNQAAKISQQLKKSTDEEVKGRLRLQKANADQRRELKRLLELETAQEGTRRRAILDNKRLKESRDKLNLSTAQGVAELKRINSEINKNNALLVTSNDKLGQQKDGVGNYSRQWNGLGNSINQVSRELPAFAVSAQTGILALSNNLPILFDEISRTKDELAALRKEGKKAPSLFSRIASSIFSWGTALSVGVTLLTVFGKEIGEFISSIGKADKAFKISAESQSDSWAILSESIDNIIDKQIELNVVTGVWTEERAEQFKSTNKLNRKIIDSESLLRKDLVEVAKKLGVELNVIWDKTNRQAVKFETDKNKVLTQISSRFAISNQQAAENAAEGIIRENEKNNKVIEVAVAEHNKRLERLNREHKVDLELIDAKADARKKTNDEKADKNAIKREKDRFSKILAILTQGNKDRIKLLEAELFFEEKLNIQGSDNEQKIANIKIKIENERIRQAKANLLISEAERAAIIANSEKIITQIIIDEENRRKDEKQRIRDIENEIQRDNLNTEIKLLEGEKNKTKEVLDEILRLREQALRKQAEIDRKEVENSTDSEEEKAAKIRQINAELFNDLRLLNKKHNDDVEKLQQQRTQFVLNAVNDSIQQVNQLLAARTQQEFNKLDRQIQAQQDRLRFQQQRAAEGLSNTLEQEQRVLGELEIQREELAKKEERRQFYLTFLTLLASYAKQDASTAFSNTSRDMGKTLAVKFAFAEKGGIAGEVKDSVTMQDGVLSKTHGSGNDVAMILSKKEGILNEGQMAKLGGPQGFHALTDAIDNGHLNDGVMLQPVPVFTENLATQNNKQLISEIRTLQDIVKNKKELDVRVDQYGNVIRREVENGHAHILKTMRKPARFE